MQNIRPARLLARWSERHNEGDVITNIGTIGSAAAIGCAVYGGVCAGLIASYCVIAAIHLNY